MNQDKKIIKTVKKVYPQIYAYTLPDQPQTNGWQKIGYTERQDVEQRIYEQTHTAAMRLNPQIMWSASAIYEPPQRGKFFNDHDFHKFLIKNQTPKDGGHGKEWFYFNGQPEKSLELFKDYTTNGLASFNNNNKLQYQLRPEQAQAVEQTLAYATNNQTTNFDEPQENAKFLWNAKPRFGKTLSTYDFAQSFSAKNVLIVTNRPAIANSWFDDYEKFVEEFYFISTTDLLKERKTLSREQFNQIADLNKKQITFLSMQDLKGGKIFGGPHNKLQWVADLNWDLVVIDEAHEGSTTPKADRAFEKIKRRFTLWLSGTPFKILADNNFSEDQIYNWSYLDEQKAKQAEIEHGDEAGVHVNLPDLRLFTYKLSDAVANRINEGAEIKDDNIDYTFDLNEFFSTNKSGKLIYEDDVKKFLNALTTNQKYPFSTPEMRNELKHTFWLVGNRIASAEALEQLLKNHPVFGQYEIILAAGDGKKLYDDNDGDDFEEEQKYSNQNTKALDRVKQAIKNHDKTITLSVGQLTTGVTVPEWSAVLMLSDIKSPASYMQAAFRAQNPHKFIKDGQLQRKKSAYVFDFAPTRVLTIFDEFANSLLAAAATGQATTLERKANVAELLNFFPVISEDRDGQMIELDAEQVLTFPKSIKAQEIVKRGFISNLLFTNISNIFNIPREVIETLNKMPTENNKRARASTADTSVDSQKLRQDKEIVINENKQAIFGPKVYRTDIEDAITDALEQNNPTAVVEKFNDRVMEPFYDGYKEFYQAPDKEVEGIKKQLTEKVQQIVEEYNGLSQLEKNPQDLANNLLYIVEQEAPAKMVVQKEEQRIEQEQKTEEDKVRDHLRAFARTIPSFIMASPRPEELTIDNLTDDITDADFTNLTSITKHEFTRLRDGFNYVENGQAKHFEGLFDKYIFNASIKEFEAKRKELADYFIDQKEDIFDYIPPQKTNQIFTPKNVVKMQVDLLEKENPGLFNSPHTTFADLYIKSGLYITEIVKRLYKGLVHQIPDHNQRIKHILENQVYGYAPTQIIYDIATNYIFGEFSQNISRQNFKQLDTAEIFKKGQTIDMKFDVIIGNPPYQEETKDTSDKPIYNLFMEGAYKLSSKVCYITPARFLFNAGKTPKKWNEKMLNDTHLKVMYYQQNSAKVFDNTDIKGGVAITYRDANKHFGKIGTFTHFEELNGIINKVKNRQDFVSIAPIVGVQMDYKFKKQFGISQVGLKTNVFDKQNHLFTENKVSEAQMAVLGLEGRNRIYKYIDEKYFILPKNHKKFKVYLPTSNGSGAIGEVLSTPLVGEPLVGEPLVGHTETFIGIGQFDNRKEAENLFKYIKSKFARTMLGTLKITQHNLASTWVNVPIQDFTPNSDIDWTQPITNIDQQLYKKYNLSNEEIAFIEEKVREMK